MTVKPHGPPCFCGNRGCLGLLASATGMVERYAVQIRQGRSSIVADLVDDELAALTALAIYEAAIGGDELSTEAVMRTGTYLGNGATNLLHCFNPDVVLFTGGLTGMGGWLLSTIRLEASRRTYPPIMKSARIEFGQLGERGGVVGAAGIWYHSQDEEIR